MKNKKLLVIVIAIILLIIIGVGYLLKDRLTVQQPANTNLMSSEFVTNTEDEPIRPDARVLITDDGFHEETITVTSPNDPLNALIQIQNIGSSSATVTVTNPNQTVSNSIQLDQHQDHVYFAEGFGIYEIQNTTTNQSMTIIFEKE